MKEYKVHWSRSSEKTKITANSDKEAAKMFLESQPSKRDEAIWVQGGFMSTSAFEVSQLIGEAVGSATIAVESNEQKLDKIYGVLNHIRWLMIVTIFVTIVLPAIFYNLLN